MASSSATPPITATTLGSGPTPSNLITQCPISPPHPPDSTSPFLTSSASPINLSNPPLTNLSPPRLTHHPTPQSSHPPPPISPPLADSNPLPLPFAVFSQDAFLVLTYWCTSALILSANTVKNLPNLISIALVTALKKINITTNPKALHKKAAQTNAAACAEVPIPISTLLTMFDNGSAATLTRLRIHTAEGELEFAGSLDVKSAEGLMVFSVSCRSARGTEPLSADTAIKLVSQILLPTLNSHQKAKGLEPSQIFSLTHSTPPRSTFLDALPKILVFAPGHSITSAYAAIPTCALFCTSDQHLCLLDLLSWVFYTGGPQTRDKFVDKESLGVYIDANNHVSVCKRAEIALQFEKTIEAAREDKVISSALARSAQAPAQPSLNKNIAALITSIAVIFSCLTCTTTPDHDPASLKTFKDNIRAIHYMKSALPISVNQKTNPRDPTILDLKMLATLTLQSSPAQSTAESIYLENICSSIENFTPDLSPPLSQSPPPTKGTPTTPKNPPIFLHHLAQQEPTTRGGAALLRWLDKVPPHTPRPHPNPTPHSLPTTLRRSWLGPPRTPLFPSSRRRSTRSAWATLTTQPAPFPPAACSTNAPASIPPPSDTQPHTIHTKPTIPHFIRTLPRKALNILLLRSGDVERNPGPQPTPPLPNQP